MKRFQVSGAVAAAVVCLVLIAGTFVHCHEVAEGGKFLRNDWFPVLLWLLPVGLTAWYAARRKPRTGAPLESLPPRAVPPAGYVLVGLLAVFLFSGTTRWPTFYFMNWHTRAAPASPGPNCALDLLVLATAVSIPVALYRRRRLDGLLPVLLVGIQAVSIVKLLAVTGGDAIYQDDHPSFMFRMAQFKGVFPHIQSYNPYWNGGVVDSVLADTGSIAFGLLSFPLLVFASPEQVHTINIALIFIVLVPWAAFLSARLMELDRRSAWCAAILASGVSYTFFLWMLHFGTVGSAVCSAALVPLTACLYRVIRLDRRGWWLGLLLCASAYLLVQWPPGMLMAATLGLSTLLAARHWTLRKLGFLALCTTIVIVLHLRALILILTQSHDLMGFVMEPAAAVSAPGATEAAEQTLRTVLHDGWNTLMALLLEGHPAILFLGVAGVFFLQDRRLRLWLGPPVIALAVLAGWGEQLFPNLQISRMVIPLFFVGSLAAAAHMGRFMVGRRPPEQVAAAFLAALLALGGWNTARTYGNGGYARFAVLGDDVKRMAATIQRECPRGTRVLFAGRTVHGFGRGHIAMLPLLTDREMLACDYYAFPPAMVEYEYPPAPTGPARMARDASWTCTTCR